jgi:hypothetical protein
MKFIILFSSDNAVLGRIALSHFHGGFHKKCMLALLLMALSIYSLIPIPVSSAQGGVEQYHPSWSHIFHAIAGEPANPPD